MQGEVIKKIRSLETPFYLYDRDLIIKNTKILSDKFKSCRAKIFYAVKANTSLAVLDIIRRQKIGAEVVSPGEIFISLKAGYAPHQILYNNIARDEDSVVYALKKGVVFYNFEALDQAILLDHYAGKLHKKINIFARINPGIFSDTHPHLSTGAMSSKFGIEEGKIGDVVKMIKTFKRARFVGLHLHIGSQILDPEPFVKGTRKLIELITRFRRYNMAIEFVDLGGGFGVPYYPAERPLDFRPVIRAYKKLSTEHNVRIFLEPGRFIVGNAGYIISSVISVKKRGGIPLYVIDAGMTENPRPALYDAYHHITSLLNKTRRKIKARIVGPLCENTDEFGVYYLPKLEISDRVLIHNCGAYTRTMASNYNGRLLPPEYIIEKNGLKKIRKKQGLPSLIQNEIY